MLRKEITESIKRFLECFVILLGLPIAFLLDRLIIKFGWEFKDLFLGLFYVAVFFYSAYSGITILQAEKKDRALEYLLSMPISRSKIMLMKIFSRLLILIFCIFILAFLVEFRTFQMLTIWLIFLFFISVTFSMIIDSIILGIIGISLIFLVFELNSRILFFLVGKTDIEGSLDFLALLSPVLSALLLLIPFGISFWLTFKKMDVKPMTQQIQPYYYIAFPALVIILSFIILYYKDSMTKLMNQ